MTYKLSVKKNYLRYRSDTLTFTRLEDEVPPGAAKFL